MTWIKWLRIQWDRCAAWVVIAVGALCLLLGWLGVSSTPFPAQQISYLVSGGITAVFLLGLGAMLWLSADLRDQWAKLDRIEEAIVAGGSRAGVAGSDARPVESAGTMTDANGAAPKPTVPTPKRVRARTNR